MKKVETDNKGAGKRVGIVVSRFNPEFGELLLAGAVSALREAGVAEEDITVVSVPGALETPLALQALANTHKFHALVALGAVVRGETYHFEVVSNESASGVSSVQLDSGVPIGNGILTTDSEEQARVRARDKGRDAAMAAIEMANLLLAVRELAK
jgi:6,7-dimethyl-8-ribityllumazine synthase